MRVHNFPLTESIVIPALEPHVDGFVFLTHPADEERNARLVRLPKYVAHTHWQQPFHNAPTQKAILELAGSFNPSFVIALDSDMLMPDWFSDEFEMFKRGRCWSLDFWNFECWGDADHVVADGCYRADPHCMVMRWEGGLQLGGYSKAHRFRFWCSKEICRCVYPMRHLAFMTPELREQRRQRGLVSTHKSNWRREAEGLGAWPSLQHPAIPYDCNMTWRSYLQQAGRWKK